MNEFPRFLMIVGHGEGKRRIYLSLREASELYAGNREVAFGRYVLNQDFTVDDMTPEHRDQISGAADRWASAN